MVENYIKSNDYNITPPPPFKTWTSSSATAYINHYIKNRKYQLANSGQREAFIHAIQKKAKEFV
jgi:hypothetical protein